MPKKNTPTPESAKPSSPFPPVTLPPSIPGASIDIENAERVLSSAADA